jgi:hypothetical protein
MHNGLFRSFYSANSKVLLPLLEWVNDLYTHNVVLACIKDTMAAGGYLQWETVF